jgi:hypothetical protein
MPSSEGREDVRIKARSRRGSLADTAKPARLGRFGTAGLPGVSAFVTARRQVPGIVVGRKVNSSRSVAALHEIRRRLSVSFAGRLARASDVSD